MHKDKPPGLFDFPAHSAQHAIWVGLATGMVLSFLVHASLVITRPDPEGGRRGTAKRRVMSMPKNPKNPATTPNPPLVNY